MNAIGKAPFVVGDYRKTIHAPAWLVKNADGTEIARCFTKREAAYITQLLNQDALINKPLDQKFGQGKP